MDRQVVFNRVRDHLLEQNTQSRGSKGCAYRGGDNTKCAIGALIDDNCYDETLEGYNVDSLRVQSALRASGVDIQDYNFDDIRFLNRLQRIHDTQYPEDWPSALREFAHKYGLEGE